MEDNLIELQESSKTIRNPFGFDFIGQWNSKTVVLKGDGKPRSVIGPLADHLARHLYMKVYYQFHDEQVAALKAKGDSKGALKYRVPAAAENLIWRMITGEDKNKAVASDIVTNEADLSELKRDMSKLDKQAAVSSTGINISRVLEKAQTEAINKGKGLVEGETARSSGTSEVVDKPLEDVDVNASPEIDAPIDAGEVVEEKVETVATPGDGEPETPKDPEVQGEFPELKDLD